MSVRDDYVRALEAVRKGFMTIRAAADAWGVNKSTLASYKKKGRVPEGIRQGRFKPTFSKEQEEVLVQHLIDLSETFQGMSRKTFGVLAYKTAEKLQLVHRFKNQKAGRYFVSSFLKRHKDKLSIRTASPLTQQRIEGFSPKSVELFQEKLGRIIEEHHISPQFIFNVDETGITLVPPQKQLLIAKIGAKNVPIMVPSERGQLVTVICAMNATGDHLPPMFVFRGSNSFGPETQLGPTGARSTTSPKGWCTQDTFSEWIRFFHETVAPPQDQQILLIFDNASPHMNVDAIEFGLDHNIHMLSIPSHTSHRLQPMDVGFFRPLKARYASAVRDWQLTHGMMRPHVKNIPEIFRKAYEESATAELAVNAFRKCGIWDSEIGGPNPHAFTNEDFKGYFAAAQKRQQMENQVQQLHEDEVQVHVAQNAVEEEEDEENLRQAGYGLVPPDEDGVSIVDDAMDVNLDENVEGDAMTRTTRDGSMTRTTRDASMTRGLTSDTSKTRALTGDTSKTRELTRTAATDAYNEMYAQAPVSPPKRQRKTRRQEALEYTSAAALAQMKNKKRIRVPSEKAAANEKLQRKAAAKLPKEKSGKKAAAKPPKEKSAKKPPKKKNAAAATSHRKRK